MNSEFLLSKVFNLDKWQKLQDSLSEQTKMAIVTVDYKGAPITKHSNCSQFCAYVRNHPELHKYCEKCDSRGGLEAVRQGQPYLYLCHFNIVDLAIPIINNNNYVGAVLAGQVRLNKSHSLEKILQTPINLKNKLPEDATALLHKLPILSLNDIMASAKMLDTLCNYIIEESTNKNLMISMYERLYKIDGVKHNDDYINTTNTLHSELTQAIMNDYLDENNQLATQHNAIKPAMEYIFAHADENVSLKSMAKICNISEGYFSRLFLKETGQNFTAFIISFKIKTAKGLLQTTDMTVSAISDSLGFCDAGYFNKVFKKQVGVTPAAYRKLS